MTRLITDHSLKANCNKLLDVARETYKENVSDIYQLNKSLAEEHELPITLMYQESGFVFVLKKTALVGELPRGFINVSSRKGKWLFSSMELVGRRLELNLRFTNGALMLAEEVKCQNERCPR